jgi:hypothetical protein
MRRAKAKGHKGNWCWFAEVNGELLPCVHQHWRRGFHYDDPYVNHDVPPWPLFLEEVKTKRKVIETRDVVADADKGEEIRFKRERYIAVFAVDDVIIEGRHLRFRFAERLTELE